MKLGDWVDYAEMSQTELGDLVGAGQAQISKYIHGLVIPPRPVMSAIIAVTGGLVTPNDFYAEDLAAARAKRRPVERAMQPDEEFPISR